MLNRTTIKLSIIVLFYHGERWIDSCIRSLENQSLSRDLYEMVLIDNGGSTPSVEKYRGKKNINVIRYPVNYGFAGGNNKALEHAKGEIVLLMNQDVVVHYNCLEELLIGFDHHPEAGTMSANMLMVSSNDIIDPYRSTSNLVGLYRLTPLGYASYDLSQSDKNVVPVDLVSGNALAFRSVMLKDIGHYLFDSRLKSYAEDLDFSIRLKRSAWKMYVRPKAVVYHYRDEAFSGNIVHMLWKLIHVSRNRLIVYYNNLAFFDFLKKLPFLLLGIPSKVARSDGDSRFYTLRFIIALCLLPLIFSYFGLSVFENTRKHKTKIIQASHKN